MAGSMTVRELLTKYTFKSDTSPIFSFDNAINGLKKGLFAATTAAAGLATGIFYSTKKVADYGDKLAKMSSRVGVSTDVLQQLKHAAELSGTSLDELVVGMRRLALNADQATQGSKVAQRAFKILGVSVKDNAGNLKTNEQLLLETLDGLAGMEDKTRRAALAQQVFGRSGTALLPMLTKGKAGIVEMMEEAKRLGLVLDQETLKQSEEFNDSLLRMTGSLRGVFFGFASQLMPIFREYVDKLLDWIQRNRALIAQQMPVIISGLAKGMKRVGDYVFKLMENLPELISRIGSAFEITINVIGKIGTGIYYIYKFLEKIGIAIGYVSAKFVLFDEWLFNLMIDAEKWIVRIYIRALTIYSNIIGWFSDLSNRMLSWMLDAYKSIGDFFSGIFDYISSLNNRIISWMLEAYKGIGDFFSGIWDYLSSLPGRIWNAITSGFWAAIDWVKQKMFDLFNWISEKFQQMLSLIPGFGGKELKLQLQTMRTGMTAAQQGYAGIAPVAPSAEAMRTGQGTVSIQPTINVTVPPGTPASEAERVGDAAATSSTRAFRRALGDLRR